MTTIDRIFDWIGNNTAIFHGIMAIFIIIGVIGLIHDTCGERILLWAERHKIIEIDRDELSEEQR